MFSPSPSREKFSAEKKKILLTLCCANKRMKGNLHNNLTDRRCGRTLAVKRFRLCRRFDSASVGGVHSVACVVAQVTTVGGAVNKLPKPPKFC